LLGTVDLDDVCIFHFSYTGKFLCVTVKTNLNFDSGGKETKPAIKTNNFISRQLEVTSRSDLQKFIPPFRPINLSGVEEVHHYDEVTER